MPSLSEPGFPCVEEVVELSQLEREEDTKSVELSSPVLNDDKVSKFKALVMDEKWDKVIEKYKSDIKYHSIKIKGRGTALHVAVNVAKKDTVGNLVKAIEKYADKSDSLKTTNEMGATPLHLAAYRGLTDMCELIIGENGKRKELILERNADGDTPLFWAVCAHKTLVFLYLQQFYSPVDKNVNNNDINIAVNNYATIILHISIQREMFVKNRQPHVIDHLKMFHITEIFDNLNLQVDKNKNTMLHLAAYSQNTWRISGVALQMMWDIKWYQYIKGLVPEHFSNRMNIHGKIPSEVFKEEHKKILEKSVNWMKDTAESCSVVAALIAGVSFATSSSVPGGTQQSGEPTLEGQPSFEGFAISSLVGLYFSITALIMFLSILTSRKEIEDFRINLPIKLLFGLSSLFVSIVSMFISFCAGHFFMLTDKYTKGGILFYLYISICMPVAFYAVVQFLLFLDLANVIRKKVPPSSIKGVLL